jgi:chemotaxis protein CheD
MIDEQLAKNFYYDGGFDIEAAKLLPGEYYVTDRRMLLVTVLGSCVAACLRDPYANVGGMNHFMLPESVHDADSPLSSSARGATGSRRKCSAAATCCAASRRSTSASATRPSCSSS